MSTIRSNSIFRGALLGIGFAGLCVASATSIAGCTQSVAAEDTGKISAELYYTGTPWSKDGATPGWPGGVVPVCFDPADGNNPTLLSEARTVLQDTWAFAANIKFVGWGACNYTSSSPNDHQVALHFAPGARGVTSRRSASCNSGCPDGYNVTLVSDDGDRFRQHYRYEVVHEFGHALGFSHEQERPDNFGPDGGPLYCARFDDGQFTKPTAVGGGTYETLYDQSSVMDYCTTEPLVGGPYRTSLSNDDVLGAWKVYGHSTVARGLAIFSDHDLNAMATPTNPAEGEPLVLSESCSVTNPNCQWSYQYGMLVWAGNPSFAMIAPSTEQGTVSITRSCTMSNPACTWTWTKGEFVSDANPSRALNAWGGARDGATLKVTSLCTASNPDCTWSMTGMLASARDVSLMVNAFGGATDQGPVKLHNACAPGNTDCTWWFVKGAIVSTTDLTLTSGLWLNAFDGARNGASVKLSADCSVTNPDCTWTWSHGQIISDHSGATPLPINAFNGAVFGANLQLNSACNAGNADCVFNSFYY